MPRSGKNDVFFLTMVLSLCFLLRVYVKFLLTPALNATRFFSGLPLPCSVVLDKTLGDLALMIKERIWRGYGHVPWLVLVAVVGT